MVDKKSQPVDSPPTYTKDPGPQSNRSCRDIFFLLLFILFWIGMLAIASVAIAKGDINRLKYGTDSLNNTCGVNNPELNTIPEFNATTMPYLHYLDAGFTTTPYKRCVSECPTTGTIVCRYNTTLSSNNTIKAQQILNRECMPVLFDTEDVLWRCVPEKLVMQTVNNSVGTNTTASKIFNFISDDLNARETAVQVFEAMVDTWKVIFGMAGVALILSFLWLVLINYLSSLIVWITVWFANLSTGAVAGFLFYNYYQIKTQGEVIYTGQVRIDSQVYNERTMMWLAIISTCIFALILLITIAARNRIKLAILVIKETSHAIRAIPSVVIFPLFKYIALALMFAGFIYIYGLLATSGNVIANAASQDINQAVNSTILGQQESVTRYITPDRVLPFMQIYYVFGLFWTYNFLVAVWQCTIAGTVATWYWTKDKRALPRFIVGKALARCFRFHLGSLAFGSLILAIVQLVQYLLAEAQRKLRGTSNSMAKHVLACLQCLFACVERFVKFLNKNAYIEIAVYGYSFCEASRTAFSLLLRNAFRLVIVDGVGNFLLFLGKLFITAVTSLIGLALLQRDFSQLGSFYAVPLIFIIIEAWMIASFFTTVMDMAIDTVFLCFCEDCERNDGTPEKPYYMTDSLRAFTDQHKAVKREQDVTTTTTATAKVKV